MLHITYWFPNDDRASNVYHYCCKTLTKSEVIELLNKYGYEYEIIEE